MRFGQPHGRRGASLAPGPRGRARRVLRRGKRVILRQRARGQRLDHQNRDGGGSAYCARRIRSQDEARAGGLDTGNSQGGAIVPIMVGSLQRGARVLQRVFADGINASPIIFPGVPINAARLRFFLTSEHTAEQIRQTVRAVRNALDRG